MDLDVVEERSSLAQDEPVPIQRAKRTYGSKAKPQTVQGDLVESSGLSSSFGAIPETDRAIAESMATFTASVYRPDLQLELKKIDEDYRVSDDEDENVDFRVRPKNKSSTEGILDSPSSPESNLGPLPDASRTRMRTGDTVPGGGQATQLSGNTSFASGTSGAVSSPPSTDTQSHSQSKSVPLPSSSRPGPLPHADNYQPDPDDLDEPEPPEHSSQSEPPSPQQLFKPLRREETPEIKKPVTRLLSASPFASPVKSFSSATRVRRPPPKYLGDDGDGDLEMEVIREEDTAWWTDDSASGKRKKAADEPRSKNKVKKPTKKEIVEAEKETARMRAEKDLDVQDKAEFAPLLLGQFFHKKLQQANKRFLDKVPPPPLPFAKTTKEDIRATDPIRNFSSSSPHHATMDEDRIEQLDPEQLAASNSRKATEAEAKRKLQQMKLKALNNHRTAKEEEDSDLEIVVPQPASLLTDPLSKLTAAMTGKKRPQPFPSEGKKPRAAGPRGSHHEMTKEEHNRAMRARAATQSAALMEYKKADFLARGGQLTKQNKAAAAKHTDVRDFLAKAVVKADETHRVTEEESDADDEAYEPSVEDQETLQGSSPKQPRATVLAPDSSVYLGEDEAGKEGSAKELEYVVSSAQRVLSSDEEQDEHSLGPAPLARRRPQIVISDGEDDASVVGSDDENLPPTSAVSLSASGFSSGFSFPKFTQRTLNDSSPRTPLGELPSVDGKMGLLFGGSFSFSPGQPLSPSQQRMTVNLDPWREPSPSKGLLLPAFGEVPLRKRSKSSPKPSSPFGLSAIFGNDDDDISMSDRCARMLGGFKPADFGAISTQLFQTQSSPSQRASPSKRSRLSYENKKGGLTGLRANQQDDDFFFSQAGPLGPIAISTQAAKAIKEAEQKDAEEVLKDTEQERLKRLREAEADNEPRWINDAGLFTQTKPADVPWSLTQNFLSQTPFSQGSGQTSLFPRSGELNAEQLLSQRSPAKTPARPRRLKRKGELEETEYSLGEALPASPIMKANAFEALMKPKKPKTGSIQNHNEFVQGEAEESDDELQLGFARGKTEEEEEAAIDPAEEAKLVDDTKLTEEQIREDAVIEKHMEHLAEDDAANQRIQEMAIKGQLRKTKRGHGMMEDDSSDDERVARGAKFKKRRVAGTDHLDELAVNVETIAFHQSYIKDLPGVEGTEEDYDEFAHLNKVADDPGTDGDAESDMASDSEMLSGSESGGAKATSAFDFRKQLREMASQGKDLLGEEELQDAEDFVNSFMPSSDGLLPAEYANITEMQLPRHKVNKVQRNELDVLPPPRGIAGLMGDTDRQKLALWAKENEKARDIGARGTASAAVTGHSKVATRPKKHQGSLDRSVGMPGTRPPIRQDSGSSLTKKLTKSGAWE